MKVLPYSFLWLLSLVLQPSPVFAALEQRGEEGTTIGYLMDLKGDVAILRGGTNTRVSASCITLQNNDVLALRGDVSATILLPDRAYVIRMAGQYRITEVDVVEAKNGGETAVDPVLGARGSPLVVGAAEQVVVPPKMLFTAVKPPVMRAAVKIEVLSPCGVSLSTTPDLVWTGDETNEYTAQVVSMAAANDGDMWPRIKTTGCKLKWTKTGWSSLRRDESYRVLITRQGEVLTDAGHVFMVAATATADRMEQKIAVIEKDLPVGMARAMAKASLMVNPDHGFYADARLIVVDLLKEDPMNEIYLRLLQRCYAGMGSERGFAAVQRRLAGRDPAAGHE